MPFLLDDGGDVFTPGDPPHGVCWSPTDPALEVDPTWVRLDDPQGYRLATGYSIDRGRASETDRTGTGSATITFTDSAGILDPTNTTSPFWDPTDTPPAEGKTQLDPMKQVALALMNPITGLWYTIYRGFNAGPDHELEMFTAERGRDVVTWACVDAFDLFANIILTRGTHGDTPEDLANFPNVFYRGTPVNPPFGQPDHPRHVDQRIVQLLDDAGWPGTGDNIDLANLRNIFSGNVQLQNSVYARDSLLAALFEAADAEFPGIANIYISKEGVVTFHGRYARFFPDNPGYGINHWYAGSATAAALDDDVVPLALPLRFYRTKDDIINACTALPKNIDATDPNVVPAFDSDSIDRFGYRSENFDGLIVSAGHDDDGNTTSAVVEANKFADYYVGNYSTPADRVGTLRFTSRGEGSVGAAALWDMMTRVELGDVITLMTEHAGGGGFDDKDFFVEHISYNVSPAREDMLNVQLELEVSPRTFFSYNPFGFLDLGNS